MMHIGSHFVLSQLSTFAAFILGIVVAMVIGNRFWVPIWMGGWRGLPSMLIVFGFVVLPAILTRKLISMLPAHCPKCHGRTYAVGISPFLYKCSDCGDEFNTGISMRL